MKILHVMAGQGQGGAETYSTDVMHSLHQSGIQQTIVMSKKAPTTTGLQNAGLNVDTNVLAIPFRPLQRHRFKKLIAEERPDIVHAWMRRAASLLTQPTPHAVAWFGGYYEPKHFRFCSTFVGVTEAIVQHMKDKGVASDRAFYIPTFPTLRPMPAVDRASLNTPKDAKVVLALSRLHPKKGLDTLLRALTELPGFYLWLAGEGPLQKELESMTIDLNLQDRVRFLGWRTDRSALLKSADICALPSRYEPFGTVILEAWAASVPLVAARSAGPMAYIKDEENGLLVAIDDSQALAKAIQKLAFDPGLRQKLMRVGKATYDLTFTQESVTRQWINFYHRVLEMGC